MVVRGQGAQGVLAALAAPQRPVGGLAPAQGPVGGLAQERAGGLAQERAGGLAAVEGPVAGWAAAEEGPFGRR